MDEVVKHKGGGDVPSFLSTHPSFKDRIERLQLAIQDARKVYDANMCGVDASYYRIAPQIPPPGF